MLIKRTSLANTFLALTIISSLVLLGWLFLFSPEDATPKENTKNHPSPLRISGLSYSNYQEDLLISKVQVQKLYVRPRKIGLFSIKSVNELILDQAHFEFHQWPAVDPKEVTTLGNGIATSLKGLTNLRGIGMGHIIRGIVSNMVLDVFRKEKEYLSVRSNSAIIDFKKKQTRMSKAILTSYADKFVLSSDLIIWDDKNNMFYVPGKYILTTAQRKKVGKKFRFPLNL